MDPRAADHRPGRTQDMQPFCSLSRDYGSVGTKGSLIRRWCTDEKLASVGNDRDGDVMISGHGAVQAFSVEGKLKMPALGKKGRSPGELMQPYQTALSADLSVGAVADSGNNRIQLFDARTRKLLVSIGRKGQIRPGRMQGPEGVAFVDGRPEMIVADTGNGRLQVFHVDEMAVPPDDSADGSGGGGGGDSGDDEDKDSRACLLVFEGCREAEKLRKRRTAGESETAEGPLAQPCDVAYWREISPRAGRGKRREPREGARAETDASGVAWDPPLPEWFRPHRSAPGVPTAFSDNDEEERVRRELLLSAPPPRSNSISLGRPSATAAPSGAGDKRPTGGHHSSDGSTGLEGGVISAGDGGVVGGREPRHGSFLVRETGISSRLQLLFVAKTQEAEEAEQRQNEHVDDESFTAVPDNESGEDDSPGDFDWMKPAKRDGRGRRSIGGSGEVKPRESDGGRGGEDNDSPSQDATSEPSPAFEVCEEEISVLEGGKVVEVCGRVYDSLLSLLRAFRGRGFDRLAGVTDTRGARGLVAVAERAGGRVRLLHYAPAFPPFYTTELTHLHSIEGLRRPSSVSFSTKGDLLVVDQASRKVIVYSHLSGKWVAVREFGPTRTTDSGDVGGGNRPDDCSRASRSAVGPATSAAPAAKGSDDEPPVHERKHPHEHDMVMAGALSGERQDGETKAAAAAGGEARPGNSATSAPDRQGGVDLAGRNSDPLDWAPETGPISARFVRLKMESSGSCIPETPGSKIEHSPRESSEPSEVIVVGATDGIVRIMRGSTTRHCGSFACLAQDTALDIFELLGYRSSQVLGHVNRTVADLRSTLRREWRLYPLTPGDLARRKLEFLRWGRLVTGEGIPGRGTVIDAHGQQLCDRFLATSTCSRPACPYSHHQPMIDLGSKDGANMCIVFRGGVTHAVNNLYGQIFGWEWEGDLYRLFGERSVLRSIVARHDPMTLGIDGAEVIRQCVIEEDYVLDYAGYVDFATAVHEHATGLRSWHRPLLLAPTTAPSTTSNSGGRKEVDVGTGAASALAGVAVPASTEAKAERPSLSGRDGGGSCRRRKPDAATPWLGWDFSAPHDDHVAGALFPSEATNGGGGIFCTETTREHLTVRGKRCYARSSGTASTDDNYAVSQDGRKEAIKEAEDQKGRAQDGDKDVDDGNSADDTQEAKQRDEGEEPKTNREYGTTAENREASANQVIAFQTDRVVRMLDGIF